MFSQVFTQRNVFHNLRMMCATWYATDFWTFLVEIHYQGFFWQYLYKEDVFALFWSGQYCVPFSMHAVICFYFQVFPTMPVRTLYRQVLLMNITVSLQILSHERPIYTVRALLTFRNSHHFDVYEWWWTTYWCCDVKPTEEVENQDSRDSCEMPPPHQPRVVNASRVLTGHPSAGLGMSTGHKHPNYASAPSTQILSLKAGEVLLLGSTTSW